MKVKDIISRFAVGSTTTVFLWLLSIAQVQAVTVAPLPLELANGARPNVILTFDDSGSMRRAYIPDAMNCTTAGTAACGKNLKRGCSGSFNPVFYNPAIDYMPPLDASGISMGNSTFTGAWTNGFNRTAQTTVNLTNNYRPAWIMNSTSGSSASTSISTHTDCGTGSTTGTAAYFMKYDPVGTSCSPAAITNDACYTNTTINTTSGPNRFRPNLAGVGSCPNPADPGNAACVSQNERINFANWYSYYRTRLLLAKSAAGTAFAKLDDDSIRISYQRLNTCNSGLGVADAGSCDGNYLKLFSSTARTNFFTWLYNSGANDSTPLRGATRRAGDYISTTGLYSPFSQKPGNALFDPTVAGNPAANKVEAACRQNYHVAFTDGFWRTGDTIRSGNFDTPGSDWDLPLPLGKSARDTWETYPGSGTYTSSGRFPYKDGNGSHSDSMADAAFYYWSRDARADLDNIVAPNIAFPDSNKTTEYWDHRNNPATWQHMVHFTVGLGVDGTLAFPSDLNDLISGTTTWPDTGNGVPQNVDDLWHAAINSRGQYFSASDPSKLTSSFQNVLQRVLSRSAAIAGIGTTGNEVTAGSRIYQVIYKSGDWYGRLLSFRLDPTTGDFQDKVSGIPVPEWDTSSASSRYGSAQDGVPASRVIISRDLRAGTPAGIAFTWAALTNYAADFNTIPYSTPAATDANGSARVSYLRGDATNEGVGLDFRSRSITKIGDIVNASPVFVPKGTKFNYPDGLETPNHSAFRSSAVVTGRPRVVYVAGNDGMLHGFNADFNTATNVKVADSGKELLAYVPGTLLPEMGKLSSKEYQHQWYIDTTPAVADAFGPFPGCASSPCWRTIMVGGLGGGKGIYALDVTDPANFSQANANTISLWEKNSSSTGFSEMGLTYGKPIITRIRKGNGSTDRVWAAIFSNGYNSTSGTARLYIVNIATGALIKVIDTGIGSDNGLSPAIAVIDPNNSEFVIDYIYAGDLKGKIWKFNISDNNKTNWKVAYDSNGDGTGTPVPIFTAELPAGTPQPITSRLEVGTHPDGKAGFIIYFGTGRYLTASDNGSTTVQSYYAIWDEGDTTITSTPVSRTNLLTQTITGETPAGFRTTSSNTINFESPVSHRGWHIDFNASNALGERVLTVAELSRGRLIYNTFIPSTNECMPDGEHITMIMNPRDGSPLTNTPFDTNDDGFACACVDDFLSGASGKRGRGRQGAPVTTLLGGGQPQDKLCYNDGVQVKCDPINPGNSGIGRGAWKQLK